MSNVIENIEKDLQALSDKLHIHIEDEIQRICIQEELTFDYEAFEMVHDKDGNEIFHNEIEKLWSCYGDMFNRNMTNFSVDENGILCGGVRGRQA